MVVDKNIGLIKDETISRDSYVTMLQHVLNQVTNVYKEAGIPINFDEEIKQTTEYINNDIISVCVPFVMKTNAENVENDESEEENETKTNVVSFNALKTKKKAIKKLSKIKSSLKQKKQDIDEEKSETDLNKHIIKLSNMKNILSKAKKKSEMLRNSLDTPKRSPRKKSTDESNGDEVKPKRRGRPPKKQD